MFEMVELSILLLNGVNENMKIFYSNVQYFYNKSAIRLGVHNQENK